MTRMRTEAKVCKCCGWIQPTATDDDECARCGVADWRTMRDDAPVDADAPAVPNEVAA